MDFIWIMYQMARELGQFGPYFVLAVLWYVRKNEFKHLAKDVADLKKALNEHINWHMDHRVGRPTQGE